MGFAAYSINLPRATLGAWSMNVGRMSSESISTVGNRRRAITLVVLVCSLGVWIFYDLDHPLVLVVRGIPLTWENLATRAGRPLHIPLLVCSGLYAGVSGALLAGRAFLKCR